MGGFGLGSIVEQLADLKLGELLDSPPPGFDEAVAIAKVGSMGLSVWGAGCLGRGERQADAGTPTDRTGHLVSCPIAAARHLRPTSSLPFRPPTGVAIREGRGVRPLHPHRV